MSNRSSQRAIAKSMMKSKGYTGFNKKRGEYVKKEVNGVKSRKGSHRSFFATFWREAWYLKDQRTTKQRERDAKRQREEKALAAEKKRKKEIGASIGNSMVIDTTKGRKPLAL